jgi:molecular chaperone DnaJ
LVIDVNKEKDAEQKFRDISEAYEVLENDEKRQLYDNYGHAGVDPQAAGQGFDGFQGFGGFPGGFQQGGQQVNAEELFDMFEGMFGGEGARGRGRDVQQNVQLSFFEAVNGCTKEVSVQYTDRKNPNKVNTKKVKVTIPAGVDDGVVMRIQNEGGVGMPGKGNGDLRLNIRVAKDPYFARDGANVHVELPITITQVSLTSPSLPSTHTP